MALDLEEVDREADFLDFATNLQLRQNADALAEVQRRLLPETYPGFDNLHCVEPDCGIEIPAQRLAAGRIRCTDCQTLREKRGAR